MKGRDCNFCFFFFLIVLLMSVLMKSNALTLLKQARCGVYWKLYTCRLS